MHVLLIAQIALLRNTIRNDPELLGRLFAANGFEDKLIVIMTTLMYLSHGDTSVKCQNVQNDPRKKSVSLICKIIIVSGF